MMTSPRWLIAAYTLAMIAHLDLADAWQWSWLVGDVLCVVSVLSLWARPHHSAGWWLGVLGAAQPLLFARDHLTQSLLLLTLCLAQALGASYDARHHSAAGAHHARLAWIRITGITYALAALHKLNRDFFNPTVSCAGYGWDKIAAWWPPLQHLDLSQPTWLLPVLVIATEATLALLVLTRLRRAAWALAIVFHLPLTLTMAPAFGFVMLAGLAALATPHDLTRWRALWRAPARPAALTLGLCAVSVALHGRWPQLGALVRELVLWAALVSVCATWGVRRTPQAGAPSGAPAPTSEAEAAAGGVRRSLTPPAAAAASLVVLFLLHGLLPYTGLKTQHAGAMLSNLRIDRGCWNSLIFPEDGRISDDYIRVERAWLGAPGRLPSTEETLRAQLWSPPQLRQMQRRWCKPERRPFRLEGTWRQRDVVIEDLCDTTTPLPFEGDGVFGVSLFPDALRFQKNLNRACPQACMH